MARNFIKQLCAIDLSKLNEKQRISPVGKATGLDGRVFTINGAEVLAKLQANGLQLVLNIAHEYGGKAAGWFTDFELKENGIYASLRLTALGKELLETEQYKYLSPEYLVDYDTNQVELIIGVGLVNQPNLLNEALNQINQINQIGSKTMMTEDEQKQLTRAQNSVTTLTTEKNALETENKALKDKVAAGEKAQRLSKIDNAITAGKLKPAKKDYALTIEDNAVLDTFLALEAQDTNTLENNGIGGGDTGGEDKDLNSEVFQQMGIEE